MPYNLDQPFIYKVIRADNDFYESFVDGITKSQVTHTTTKANAPLRVCFKNSFGWRIGGVYSVGNQQTTLFAKDIKMFHSKHQSTSYADPTKNFLPPVFGSNTRRNQCLVGTRFDPDQVLIQRILKYDNSTYYRPYQL